MKAQGDPVTSSSGHHACCAGMIQALYWSGLEAAVKQRNNVSGAAEEKPVNDKLNLPDMINAGDTARPR